MIKVTGSYDDHAGRLLQPARTKGPACLPALDGMIRLASPRSTRFHITRPGRQQLVRDCDPATTAQIIHSRKPGCSA